MWSPEFAHRNIKAVLQEADRQGLPVLGLGALNKAEFVNGGGARLIEEVQPKTTRLVHGNTLTGAHSYTLTGAHSYTLTGPPSYTLTGPHS